MRQSNVCSPAQNQACLLITSRLYDRRGLDCTSPLPLFNSLAHLVHLTATSPKIREILTRDGGLERLVRILRDFVTSPPPVQDPATYYGLLPPIPHPNIMPPHGGNVQGVSGSLGYGGSVPHSSLTPGSPMGLSHPGLPASMNSMPPPSVHSNWLPAALQQAVSQPGVSLPSQGAVNHQPPPPLNLASYPPNLGFSFSTFNQPGNNPNALPLTAPPHLSTIPPPSVPNVLNIPRLTPNGSNTAPNHLAHGSVPPPLNPINAITLSTRPFDREAAQRFSLAFQCIVNVGVRGSEAIRSRVVQAGTLDVVASVLEAWLVAKGFPLVVPSRRSKKRDAASGGSSGHTGAAVESRTNGVAEDDTEMQEEEEPGSRASSSAPVSGPSTRTRATTLTPRSARGTAATSSRTTSHNVSASGSASATTRAASFSANPNPYSYPDSIVPPDSAAAEIGASGSQASTGVSAHPRPSTLVRSNSNARTTSSTSGRASSSSTTRLGSSNARHSSNTSHSRNATITAPTEMSNTSTSQTTPRFSSHNTLASTASSSASNSNTSLPLTTPSATPTEGVASPSADENTYNALRGRSGTIIAHRQNSISSTTSREQSEDDNDADVEGEEETAARARRRNNRMDSGANTEESDADMEADSSNTENEAASDRATVIGAPTAAATHNANAQARPVAVADPQAMSPTIAGASLPTGVSIGIGLGNGMGMEVDVLAAVNMVMAVDGVAAFEGTQFGGEMTNAAAAEAAARAVGEGTMVENTPRAVLRNLTMLVADGGNLTGVDEEMGETNGNANRTPHAIGSSISEPVSRQSANIQANAATTTTAASNGENTNPEDGPAASNDREDGTNAANTQAGAVNNANTNASNANAANANRNRLRIMVGDAGPFRQEDVLRALQLLAYLTKYPHVRQEFYKKRVQIIPPSNLDPAQNLAHPSTPSKSNDTFNQGFPATSSPAGGSHATVTAVPPAAPQTQITTLFSLVERFTFRPSVSHLNLHPSIIIPTIPPEIQSWAAVIMRNACRKDDSRGGIRQCANMTCGKWEKSPREFAKCRRCRKAKYCGKECQSKAWSMGHRYWCSAREGEQGQVQGDLDQENEDGGGDGNNNNNAGNGTGPTVVTTTPGGGLMPAQPTQTQTRTNNEPPNGQLPRTQYPGFPTTAVQRQTATVQGFGTLVDTGGVLPTNNYRPSAWPTSEATGVNGQTQNANQPSNSSTSGNGTVTLPRRRDAPTATPSATSASASRFVWDRLRAFGGNSGTNNNNAASLSASTPTTTSTAAQQDGSGTRARAWDRFFSREGGSNSSTSAAQPSSHASTASSSQLGVPQRPSRPSRTNSSGSAGTEGISNDPNMIRQFMSLSGRNRGTGLGLGYPSDEGSVTEVAPTPSSNDLAGMVRNGLVLAAQVGQQTQRPSTLGRRAGSGPPNLVQNGRLNSLYEAPRAGVIGRGISAGSSSTGSPAVVDPSTASGTVWTPSNADSDVNMD